MNQSLNIGIISNQYQPIFNRLIPNEYDLLYTDVPVTFDDFKRLSNRIVQQRYMDVLIIDYTYFIKGTNMSDVVRYVRERLSMINSSVRIIMVIPNLRDKKLIKELVAHGVLDIVMTDTDSMKNQTLLQKEDAIAFDVEQAIKNPKPYAQMSHYLNAEDGGMGERGHTLITLYSPKGGVGTTTLACELAMVLAKEGKAYTKDHNTQEEFSVCLFDLNDNGMLAFRIPSVLDKMNSVSNWRDVVCIKIEEEKERVARAQTKYQLDYVDITKNDLNTCMIQDESGLWIMPTLTLGKETTSISEEETLWLIEHLKQMFDVVIVDTPSYLPHAVLSKLTRISTHAYILSDATSSCGIMCRSYMNDIPSLIPALVHSHDDMLSEMQMEQILDASVRYQFAYEGKIPVLQESGHTLTQKEPRSGYIAAVSELADSNVPILSTYKLSNSLLSIFRR